MAKSAIGERKFLIIGVLLVVGVFLFLVLHGSTTNGNSNNSSGSGSSSAPASLIQKVTSIPASVFDGIGQGTADGRPKHISAPALISNGKPEVFYEGAEYCPYCATERWAMVAALSRFGTFSKLGVTHSSTTDVYPNTQTLSFYGSTYTSPYISFVPVEIETNIPTGVGFTTLQTPTSAQSALVNTYDSPPYVSSSQSGAIPFIDFGGSYVISGATYSPALLQGLSADSIASSMGDQFSPIAKGADGAANTITAAICKLTKNMPSSACDPAIQEIEKTLN
ncbi:MAG TPA: DUF929 family protein [Candidatus Saccharimonadales bacterium]|nr:DUF929 family protein [Candidatus Saccharimonadales bacterium]